VGASFGILTSLLVAMLGQARYMCVIGRSNVVPSWFARVHPRTSTPVNASAFLGIYFLRIILSYISSYCSIVMCFSNIYLPLVLFHPSLGTWKCLLCVCVACVSYVMGFECVISDRGGKGTHFQQHCLWLGCDLGSSVMIEVFFSSLM